MDDRISKQLLFSLEIDKMQQKKDANVLIKKITNFGAAGSSKHECLSCNLLK